MTHQPTYTINNELNLRFSFLFFHVNGLSLLKSLVNNLFLVKTLQIQFYNLQGNKDNPTINQSQNERDGEDKDAFSVQFVDNGVISFDTVLFPKDFKIPI